MMSGESISRADRVAALPSETASREADLVLRAQRRLPDAWTQIYHENYEKLFRYAYARVGHREMAEDLAATVFLEALKSIGGYRHGDRPFLAWLYSIARNVVNQYHRRRLRRGINHVALREISAAMDGGSEASRLVERLDLLEAVGRLPESQSEVLLLHYFVGLTIPEVAQLLGKHERAVYSLQTRAVQGMRRRLDDGETGKFRRRRE